MPLQSSALHFQEQHINDGLEDDLFGALDGDDECNMNGIVDLFGTDWDSTYRHTHTIRHSA